MGAQYASLYIIFAFHFLWESMKGKMANQNTNGHMTKRGGYITISPKKRKGFMLFLLALPFAAFYLMFQYIPLFAWAYTLFDYKVGKPFLDFTQVDFVGIHYFRKLFTESSEILRVLRNTLVLSILGILASPLPIVFAILLNEIRSSKFKKVIQTVTTLPNFISWIVVFSLAHAMFSENGLITSIINLFGAQASRVGLLGNINAVWLFHLCLGIWKSLGWSAIIYIAAIAGIDAELYDACMIDGANRFRLVLHVTVPGIAPTYLVLLLLAISNLLSNGFDQYFMFYNSMVADRIEVLDYYVYKVGFLIGDYSYSITIGMLKTLISVFLLFSANFISKKIRGASLI